MVLDSQASVTTMAADLRDLSKTTPRTFTLNFKSRTSSDATAGL